jgi:hypothetical protein
VVAYRVGDLQHRSRSSGLVTAHNVLEHDIARRLLFCSEDGSADYGGVLVVGEVLCNRLSNCRGRSASVCIVLAYRAGEASLEETGTSVEDYGERLASWHWQRGGVEVDDTDGCFRHAGRMCVCEEKEEEYKERRKEEAQSV